MRTKAIVLLLVSLSLSIFVYRQWLNIQNIYTYGDWGFFYSDTVKEMIGFPSLWNLFSFGGVDLGISLYPIGKFAVGQLSHLFPSWVALNIIYFWPSVVLPVIGSFFLGRYLFKSNIAGFVCSLVFPYTTYMMI